MSDQRKKSGFSGEHPVLSLLSPMKVRKGKFVSPEEAVRIIRDGDTIITGGFVGCGYAEEVSLALERRFLETGKPRDLTLVYAAGQGDGKDRGLNQLAHEGLLETVIGGHWGLCPKLQELALNNKIAAYCLPQGIISQIVRDSGACKPRTISNVGLGTFVDPRLEGGKINEIAADDLVEIVSFDRKEYLSYRTFPIDIAILRGTTADVNGNITMEKEALILDARAAAIAAKNNNGFVIVQVERIAEQDTLHARDVVIPGIMVDCVVVSKPEHHWQTFAEVYNPAYSGEIRVPVHSIPAMDLNARKIIARRAALELEANSVVNLGIGMPEGVASVANEEKVLDFITLTAEPGTIGGITAGGLSFGASVNPQAIIDMTSQFDFYDGGGLDVAFLGMAQADRIGNVNVSKFGPRLAGAGGFINISQNARKCVFMGTFTAGGLDVAIQDGRLEIRKEGKSKKMVEQVEQITFSGEYAARDPRPILYVTERCVFTLSKEGIELTEIAPGVDLEKDILALMDFRPIINGVPQTMDPRVFKSEPMGLKDGILELSLEHRLSYHAEENLFFVNLEGFSVNSVSDIQDIEAMVHKKLAFVNKRVFTIVNYDNFSINPDLIDQYTAMVRRVVDKHYSGTTRYTTSAFLRMKLGESLEKRELAPHIYETAGEAVAHLNE
jgi:propionate CoA-transferase